MKRSPSFSLYSKALAFIFRLCANTHAPHSSSYSTAAVNGAPQPHFMAEYLVTSCGFSPEKAAEASKALGGIKSRKEPDSVQGFFKSYGFGDAEVKKLLSLFPKWLLLDVEKTLAPKFRAFRDLGFSHSDIPHLILSNSAVINYRLNTVVSKIQFWQGLLGSNDALVKIFKQGRWLLGYSMEKRIQPNIEMLRDCGITDRKLAMILRYHPKILAQKKEVMKALINRAEGLGVPRNSSMFHWTLWVLYTVTPKKFDAHLQLFRSFGWSEADFHAAFRKCPTFLTCSSRRLQKKMEFLVHEVGCDPSVFFDNELGEKILPKISDLDRPEVQEVMQG